MTETIKYNKDIVNETLMTQEIIAKASEFTTFNPLTELEGLENTKEPDPAENIHITTANALSAGDKTIMDAIVAAHPDATIEFTAQPIYSNSAAAWFYEKTWIKKEDQPYVGTDKNSWKSVGLFEFPGTNAEAFPDFCHVVASSKDDDGAVGVRIVDIKAIPPVVICEKTDIAAIEDTPNIFSLGMIENLPANPSVFEIEIKKVEEKIYLHYLRIGQS